MRHRDSKDEAVASYYGSHAFVKKRNAPILQAADLLVWQGAKFMKDKISEARPIRADLKSLLEHRHVFSYVVFENSKVAVSMDESPHIENKDRDKYLKSMFSSGKENDLVLDEYHRFFEIETKLEDLDAEI